MKNSVRLLSLVIGVLVSHPAHAYLKAQMIPVGTVSDGSGSAGAQFAYERESQHDVKHSYTFTLMGPYSGVTRNDVEVSLSFGMLLKIKESVYFGGRVGIIAPDPGPTTGFGSLVLQYQASGSSWIYDIDLGISGSGYPHAVAAVGWRFF